MTQQNPRSSGVPGRMAVLGGIAASAVVTAGAAGLLIGRQGAMHDAAAAVLFKAPNFAA